MKYTEKDLYIGLQFTENLGKKLWTVRKNSGHISLGDWEVVSSNKGKTTTVRYTTDELLYGLNSWNIEILNYEIY